MKRTTTLILIFALLFIYQKRSIAQSWTAKAPLPVNELQNAVSFSIGSKGYVVTGVTFSGTGSTKLWEYDPATDSWTAKSDFPGATRMYAAGFSIGTKGYVGTGQATAGSILKDFWEWDQMTDTWTQKTNFAGTARKFTCSFSIDSLGYIGGGWEAGITGAIKNDFWQYSPATDSWISRAHLPTIRYGMSGFSIGSKGYVSGGDDGSGVNFYSDLLEYDAVSNSWSMKASLPSSGGEIGRGRNLAFAFSIGTKGYIGTGVYIPTNGGLPVYCSDFWEWDQLTNTWTMKASFPGGNRQWSIGFGIGANGYAGTGERTGISFNDLWEFGSGATSIDDLNSEEVSISPNPGNGIFQIHFPSGNSSTEIKIFNAIGEIVLDQNISGSVLDLSHLKNGIYSINAINSDHLNTRKIIISK